MDRKLRLKEEEVRGQSVRLYTVQEVGQETDRVHQFFESESVERCSHAQRANCSTHYYRCRNTCFRQKHLTDLYMYMYEVAPERGFRFDDKRALAHAKLYEYPVGVVKAGPFRVYGLFLGDQKRPLFVATGGGYKHTRTIQEDPQLTIEFEFAKTCMKAIRRARIGVEETKLGTLRLTPNFKDTVLNIN